MNSIVFYTLFYGDGNPEIGMKFQIDKTIEYINENAAKTQHLASMRILPLCMHRPTKATRRIYLPHSIKFIEKSNKAKYVINIFFSCQYN